MLDNTIFNSRNRCIAVFLLAAAVGLWWFPVPGAGIAVGTLLLAHPLYLTAIAGWFCSRALLAGWGHYRNAPVLDAALPSVSVIIPAYNELDDIAEVVLSVTEQDYPAPVECIVVNDGSTDGTGRLLDTLALNIDALRVIHQENAGQGVAKNRGLDAARHEVVVGVDADTEVCSGSLRALVAPLADDTVAAVAGNVQIRNDTASLVTRCQSLEYLLSMDIARMYQWRLRHLLCISGAFGAFRRETLVAEGGWLTGTNCAEDFGITLSMHQYGRVAYAPGALARTDGMETFRQLTEQRIRWTRNGLWTIRRHWRKFGNPRYGLLGVFALPFKLVTCGLLCYSYGLVAIVLLFAGDVPFFGFALTLAVFTLILFAVAFAVTVVERATVGLWALPWYFLLYQPAHALMRLVGILWTLVEGVGGLATVLSPWQIDTSEKTNQM